MEAVSDLYSVELVEGLPVRNTSTGQIVHYKRVMLCEATFAHHQNAMRSVQELRRCADDGVYRLVHNQEALDAARMVQQIDRFSGAGADILGSDIDVTILGKLHPLDVMLISDRLLQIELAAQLRWQLITAEEYEMLLAGKTLQREGKPLSAEETLLNIKRVIDAVARITHTSIDTLRQMSVVELVATLQNLADPAR